MFTIATVLCLLSFDDTLQCTNQITPRNVVKDVTAAATSEVNRHDQGKVEGEKSTMPSKTGTPDEFVLDPVARAWFEALFEMAEWGHSNVECAAWVSGVPGQYRFDPWPRTDESNAMTAQRSPKPNEWNVHTHPNDKVAWPSSVRGGQDRHVAERTGKPIYTIHRSGIWKFDPKTNRITQLLDYSWRDGVDRQMVELIVSYIQANDKRSGIKNKIETAQFAYSKARQSGKRKRAASKLNMIKQALEELDLAEFEVQKRQTNLKDRIQGLGLENAVVLGPGASKS